MADAGHTQIIALAIEIADMVRREGLHDYRCVAGQECATASLCGLCVHTDGHANEYALLRIHAADLDIEFGAPANDPAQTFMRFRRGTVAELAGWHRQLCGLRRFLAQGMAA